MDTLLLSKKSISLLLAPNWLRFIALLMTVVSLNACAVTRKVEDKRWHDPISQEKELERNEFRVASGEDLIGRMAVLRLEKGDTLPDIARHFSLGINEITAANPGVDVWVPKAGERIILPLSFILPEAPRKGIVINIAGMRLFRFKQDGNSLVVSTYPIGIGMKEKPTPTGQMRVERKAARPTWYVPASIFEDHRKKGDPLPSEVPPGPLNPLGEWALYLSKSGYLIHGTNKPASIGLEASNGCIRLYPENVQTLYHDTPVNTAVVIINQPYLIGRHNGELYLEAHTPLQRSDTADQEKVFGRLKSMEKKTGRKVDWERVKKTMSEARGVPVPVLAPGQRSETAATELIEVKHPAKLYGLPEIPELKLEGWYVLAADVSDEIEARRIAAIINHQGPPIPARVLPNNKNYRVMAGPFSNVSEAKDAVKRLKIDLEIDSILVEPVVKPESSVSPPGSG